MFFSSKQHITFLIYNANAYNNLNILVAQVCQKRYKTFSIKTLICNILFIWIEKDWEDIKKMPEHAQFSKDFKRQK